MGGLERQAMLHLPGSLLALNTQRLEGQRTQVWFPAPTWWLKTLWNSSSKRSVLFWPPQAPGTAYTHCQHTAHVYKQSKNRLLLQNQTAITKRSKHLIDEEMLTGRFGLCPRSRQKSTNLCIEILVYVMFSFPV